MRRGAYVVYGGIHATLYPDEARDLGGAHAVVTGDGDRVWPEVLPRLRGWRSARPVRRRTGRRRDVPPGRWDLLPRRALHVGLGADGARVPEALLVLLGLADRWPASAAASRRIRCSRRSSSLRRRGFRFIALADDNFYPVTLEDLRMASRRKDPSQLERLQAIRAERFELMEALAQLPADTVFFTQITMEAAEDPEFLDAMRRAHIKGALVGVEAVTPEGLKDIYKDFNESGESLVEPAPGVPRARRSRPGLVHLRPAERSRRRPSTPTLSVAERADLTFAQFVMLTPFPGTLDFAAWEKSRSAPIHRASAACRSRVTG